MPRPRNESNILYHQRKDLIPYLKHKEDARNVTIGSVEKIELKCPSCGFEKRQAVRKLCKTGFNCNICSDRLSLGERMVNGILAIVGIDFTPQKRFDWSVGRIYDVWIPTMNTIIEVHGSQHYTRPIGKRTLEEEQENDILKEKLAKENGIQHYIIVNASETDFEFIKTNISSSLNEVLNLNEFDWDLLRLKISTSRNKDMWEKWDSELYTTTTLGKEFGISRGTTRKILILGSSLGLCNYNPSFESTKTIAKNSVRKQGKKIMCINTGKVFDSVAEAQRQTGIKHIGCCAAGKRNYAGKSENGENLVWKFI